MSSFLPTTNPKTGKETMAELQIRQRSSSVSAKNISDKNGKSRYARGNNNPYEYSDTDVDDKHGRRTLRFGGLNLNINASSLARVRFGLPVVAVLLLAAFVTGRWFAFRSFAAIQQQQQQQHPLPPESSQFPIAALSSVAPQNRPTDWQKKYEDIVASISDAAYDKQRELADKNKSNNRDSTKTSHEKSNSAAENERDQAKKDFLIAQQDMEKDRQMEELMKNAHKESSDNKPVAQSLPDIVVFESLPASSVWCSGNSLATRVCRFRNICYSEKTDWFIVLNNASIVVGVPSLEEMAKDVRVGVVEISTIEDHPYTAWMFEQVSQFAPEFQNRKVRYHKDPTVLFKRFHANNIMHSLHDDVIPLYHHILEHFGGSMDSFEYMDFDLQNHKIQFVDLYEVTETFRPFQYLTDLHIGLMADLIRDTDVITCFRDATAGVRKLTTWYQYGFNDPQGPILNKFVNGLHVRQVSDFFISRLGLINQDYYGEDNDVMYNAGAGIVQTKLSPVTPGSPLGFGTSETTGIQYIGEDLIIILSRTRNRLILNELLLVDHLERTFKHKVILVRNENQSFEDQIALMRKAKVVIAMHGSILILGMFCRKGTVIIELYPWAVPSDHYTPYKTMAQLNGMNLVYRAWENTHPENSVSHPDWSEDLGGIQHLSQEEQDKILSTPTVPLHLCCVDPYWLFRIYQDTVVDIPEITALILDALKESSQLMAKLGSTNTLEVKSIMPPLITGPMFFCVGDGRPEGSLWIRWMEPWNGAKPDYYIVRTRIDGAPLDLEEPYVVYRAETTELFVNGYESETGVIFSVKSIVGNTETAYGDEAICII
ncbi:Protein O-linked-mannose beta-1,4-N-acetylglucosaminyltransferase 2 [Physocladia obscura]|uniref:Protein O-linked-mannose beta-1,4-N-acetylglucosaminyltransferase 2 n=1 Tax=Physocladia obscura TaxID=109957 RepID=A0AAD5XHC5_9FUNG|nr:Protein O-linked-mannose beta-1,4-N-acetylglucosaminyltransferase 2 [Physocladia obscura]